MWTTATLVSLGITALLLISFVVIVYKERHLDRMGFFFRDSLALFGLCIIAGVFLISFTSAEAFQSDFATGSKELARDLAALAATWVYWLVLFLGALLWRRTSREAKWFFPYAGIGALIPIVVVVFWPPSQRGHDLPVVDKQERESDDRLLLDKDRVAHLRKQYPFESLETRLPARHAISKSATHLTETSKKQLQEREDSMGHGTIRADLLKELHKESVEVFVKREGFGIGRGRPQTLEALLENYPMRDEQIPQPGGPLSSSWSEVDTKNEPSQTDWPSMFSMHKRMAIHFANPADFGYIKDRRQVAGFQPHRVRWLQEEKPWKIMRLDLVGILMAETPRVYDSDELPRMDKLHMVPTRALDTFEAAGLAKLHAGEDLFVRDVPEGVRMLGAIRSVKQCIKCHGGERGDLLGAFSYCLTLTSEK